MIPEPMSLANYLLPLQRVSSIKLISMALIACKFE